MPLRYGIDALLLSGASICYLGLSAVIESITLFLRAGCKRVCYTVRVFGGPHALKACVHEGEKTPNCAYMP